MAPPTCLAPESCGLKSRVQTLTELRSAVEPNSVLAMSQLPLRALPIWPRFAEPRSRAIKVTWVTCHMGNGGHVVRVPDKTQASGQATRPSITKSECTSKPEVFSEEGLLIEVIQERLEFFEIVLELKMTLNLDRMPTLEARIAYKFSRTSGTAQGYIAAKI